MDKYQPFEKSELCKMMRKDTYLGSIRKYGTWRLSATKWHRYPVHSRTFFLRWQNNTSSYGYIKVGNITHSSSTIFVSVNVQYRGLRRWMCHSCYEEVFGWLLLLVTGEKPRQDIDRDGVS
jgi:hypothetical protein